MVVREDGDARVAQQRRGVLDLVAGAGVEILAATSVTIAVGNGRRWSVEGGSGPTETAGRGWLIEGADILPRGQSAQVMIWQLPGEVLQVAVEVEQVLPASGCRGAAVLGEPRDGWSVLVLAAGSKKPPAEMARRMQDLLEAAEGAVSAELDGDRQRLRAVLDEREEERRRWARELHDETLQQLGALQVLLTSARRSSGGSVGGGPDALAAAVDDATALLAGQISSLRHLITELRPAALDELGLRFPLQALAQRTEALTGLRVEMEVSLRYSDGEVATRLLPDIEVAVYRVVQEALTNAGRHSGASWARVSVVERGGHVYVEIVDDGRGLARQHSSGFGIRGMRERAALAGGRLEVLAANGGQLEQGGPNAGTLIRLVVPATHRSGDEQRK